VSEQRDDALDEDALEASTVIERRTDAGAAGPLRLSPLQPLARVEIPVIRTPVTPQLSIVLPAAEPPPPEPPPPALLIRSGSEPARPRADPWPTGSARRSHATRPAPAVRTGDGRRLLLVGVLAFAGGVLVRHLWPRGQAPASLPATVAPAGGPPAQPAAPALATPPSTAPAPAVPRPTPGPKRRRRGSF
jgi:hypothetical protein